MNRIRSSVEVSTETRSAMSTRKPAPPPVDVLKGHDGHVPGGDDVLADPPGDPRLVLLDVRALLRLPLGGKRIDPPPRREIVRDAGHGLHCSSSWVSTKAEALSAVCGASDEGGTK